MLGLGIGCWGSYFGHGPFPLEHLDEHGGLVVLVSRKCLGFLGGDDGVSVDDFGHHTTYSLDTLGERGHI